MSAWKYPDEVAKYITDHAFGTTTRRLTVDLNLKFSEKYSLEFTESKVRSYKKNHKIRSMIRTGNQKGCSLVYPAGMREFITNIAAGKTTKELADAVNRKYGAGTITEKKMRAYKRNNNIVSGIDCRFQKGHEPVNKGKKMSPEQYEKSKATMFKKGNVPKNHMEVGEYTHTKDGYLIVAIRKRKKGS